MAIISDVNQVEITPKSGSRVIKVGNNFLPVAGAETDDFSMANAEARDVRSGKIVVSPDGGMTIGTLFVPDVFVGKVVYYQPYLPAAGELLDKITISGITSNEDIDYSFLNGAYYVTDETCTNKDPFTRIYKHESGEWYIWGEGYIDEYDNSVSEASWYIGHNPESGLFCFDGELLYENGNIISGNYELWDGDWNFSFSIYVSSRFFDYREQQSKIRLIPVSSASDGEDSLMGHIIESKSFTTKPQIGNFYLFANKSGSDGFFTETGLFILDEVKLPRPRRYRSDGILNLFCETIGSNYVNTNPLWQPNENLYITSEKGERSVWGWNFDGGYILASNGEKPDEDDDYFDFGEDDFTWEADIYAVNNRRQCIFSAAQWDVDDNAFAIAFSYNQDLRISAFGTESDGWGNAYLTPELELNRWYHVAIQRKDDTLYCLIDGVKTSYQASMSNKHVGKTCTKFTIGCWPDDPGDFDAQWQGYMDNIRISTETRYEV